jgi:16S rRNA (guanine527-N7)-methyltransferase
VEHDPAENIRARLEAHGFDPQLFLEPLVRLCELLAVWNRQSNLTGQRTPAEMASGICADAIALASVLPDATGIADLGSGAGFPGIPLAILRPKTGVLLVEARERRHHFQRAAQRQLGLRNVSPLLGRAEQLEPQPRPLALAQAMAEPVAVLGWLVPWTQSGGRLCLPLSSSADPEHWRLPAGVVFEALRPYAVLPEGRERLLWIGRKTL